MELKYVVLTIIKILISVPAVLLYEPEGSVGEGYMGGHLDNKSNSTRHTPHNSTVQNVQRSNESEEIPDPSALISPGYNLPENIFNKGKPFYLEKDPLTGKIDFENRTPAAKLDDDFYDYADEAPSGDIYDKANIDRKDGPLGSHRPSDVNQLTPNFHDFLNLPVKYNSDKYVYPLISSSYANTKIQGNVHKYQNHKDYNVKTSTVKATASPTYYISTRNPVPTSSSIASTTTTQKQKQVYLTSTAAPAPLPPNSNIMDTGMNHPSFHEEFNDYYEDAEGVSSTLKNNNVNSIYLTTTVKPSTTTKGTISLFLESFFGGSADYDEATQRPKTSATTPTPPTPKGGSSKPPSLFSNLPNNKNTKTKYEGETKTEKPSYASGSYAYHPNSHAGPANVLDGSNMGLGSDEYEYEYSVEDSNATAAGGKPEGAIRPNNISTTQATTTTTRKPTTTTTTTTTTARTTTTTTTTPTPHPKPKNETRLDYEQINSEDYEEYDYHTEKEYHKDNKTAYVYSSSSSSTTKKPTTTKTTTTTARPTTSTTAQSYTMKVTSLPLGENHVGSLNNRQPIIVATQNLREQLNHEKVMPKPFGFDKPQSAKQPPSTSNIHIAPDQDMVSFVVGNHQNVDGGGNSFRPVYGSTGQGYSKETSVSYSIQAAPIGVGAAGSAVTIQPQVNSEASLAIGVPVGADMKQVKGQVVDEKLEINNEKVEFPKGTGSKIVFPKDEKTGTPANMVPPQPPPPNREVLKLNSKPIYHQLPSDLTPPREQPDELKPPPRIERPRPPWDPRPGHFYSGKPEYVRPPRPPPDMAYKRIDTLPNILPQFRPNANMNMNRNNPYPNGPHPNNGHAPHPNGHAPPQHYLRQPLLDRPSNRPIGFFEKLQPPPPPKNLQHLRKIPPPPPPPLQSLEEPRQPVAEDRIMNEAPGKQGGLQDNQYDFYHPHTPPKVVLANRRNSLSEGEAVETLQMIQSKKSMEKKEHLTVVAAQTTGEQSVTEATKDGTTKPLYVVYPVNTPPIKLDVIDTNKKESVVIGTRAEAPLPPSKINHDFSYEYPKERHDAPVLKPHPRPPQPAPPIKSDFPYPLEKPDPSILNPAVPEAPGNHLLADDIQDTPDNFVSNNQWNTIGESRIQTKTVSSNQISATLKTYTEKPIAVAYTPTEPHKYSIMPVDDRYSMPNYGSPVIPEIRPGSIGTVDNAQLPMEGKPDSEFTVSAVMHTHQVDLGSRLQKNPNPHPNHNHNYHQHHEMSPNHRIDLETSTIHHQQDFQAPFQASVSVDQPLSQSQGWAVVRDKNKSTTESSEVTTMPLATTKQFDIENFKPELIGGFKPIYSYPEEQSGVKDTKSGDEEDE